MYEHEVMAFGDKHGASLARWLRMHFGGPEFAGSGLERSSGTPDRPAGSPPVLVHRIRHTGSTDRESSLHPAQYCIPRASGRLWCDLHPVLRLRLPGSRGRCYSRGCPLLRPDGRLGADSWNEAELERLGKLPGVFKLVVDIKSQIIQVIISFRF